MVKLLSDNVLVRLTDQPKSSGLLATPGRSRRQIDAAEATVLAVGPGALVRVRDTEHHNERTGHDVGPPVYRDLLVAPDVQPLQRCWLESELAGQPVEIDGVDGPLRIVRAAEILAVEDP